MIKRLEHINIVVSDLEQAKRFFMLFGMEDIEAEVAKLRAQGVEFLSDIFVYERLGKKLVYFYGPDRILLELAEYPKAT